MDGSLVTVERYLHAVQAGFIQALAQLRGQAAAIGVEPGDEPLGSIHQLHQVVPEGRFTAGEGHLRDIGRLQAPQNLLPLGAFQLPALAHGLAGGIAVQAFLVAVPQTVPGHGADHEVHAVGGGHLIGVLAQRQRSYLHLRLLPPGNGDQGAEEDAHVLPQDSCLHEGIDLFSGAPDGLLQHGIPVGGADLQTGVRFHAVHEFRQKNRPGEVQRHKLGAVEQQQKRVIRCLGVGRDHMNANHSRTGGVQGNMTHAGQMLAAVAVFTKRQMAHRKPPLLLTIG